MSAKQRIFISSVQKELALERRAIKDFIRADPLLSRFFEVFLFEDLPAADLRADAVYLSEVDRCTLYLALFGNDYGFEDAQGISPTEHEFDRATTLGKPRLIYVRGGHDDARHPKMRALLRKAGDQLIRRRFGDTSELIAAVNASLVEHLAARARCAPARLMQQPAMALRWPTCRKTSWRCFWPVPRASVATRSTRLRPCTTR